MNNFISPIQNAQRVKKYKILQPSINTIENLCSEALMNAEKQIFDKLTFSLSITQKDILDNLLNSKEKSNVSYLNWLKQTKIRLQVYWFCQQVAEKL